MRKRILLYFIIFISAMVFIDVSATVFMTTKDKVGYWGTDTYKVRSVAYWEYENGIFNSRGNHQTLVKPNNTLFTSYYISFNSIELVNNYEIRQYFLPTELNHITYISTTGPVINVLMTSPGPQ